jgi:TolB-like protein
MEFRVGINMGDVVVEGDNLYGDGVNIAARLEALAQPNGVCLSRSVHEFINKKMDFLFNDLGEQTVKDNKFHAFDVVIDDSHKRTVKTKSKSKVPLIAAIVGILDLGIGGYAYYMHSIEDSGQQDKQVTISDRPTILDMPFANQSGNKEQDYIGMGMTSHLVTMLSQFDQLLVLAKNTGEHILKNKIPNEEVVQQYGVQYVLNGTTQAAGNKVRVNVELANIVRNNVIWSEVYDFSEDDIFEIQDKVGNSVLGHLGQEVIAGSATAGRRFKNPETQKNFVTGQVAYQSWTTEGHDKAVDLWGKNSEIDPDNPTNIMAQGWLLHQKALMGISKNPQEDLQKAHKMAVDALEKNPDHAMLMALATTLEGMFGDFEASCPRVEKLERLAREINEIVMTAETQRQCGKYKKSIETYEKAFQISPHYSAWIKQHYTYALLQNGDLEAAKKYALEQSV